MTKFEEALILSRAEWGELFSNKVIKISSYICLTIGLVLLFINSGFEFFGQNSLERMSYTVMTFCVLIFLFFGILRNFYFSIPISILLFNFIFIFFIILDTFVLKIGINAMTVSYNVLYFIINAIVFKLRPVLFLNGCVFVFSAVCAFYSLHMDLVPKGAGEPAMMRNALVLSFAGLVLQHLVLNVRAMLVEQLAHIKVQVAALQAEVLVQDARKMAIEKAERLNRMSVLEVLSASIAHEINQPVAAAVTYCQAARNWALIECKGANETIKALDGVEANVGRAARIVDNIRLLTSNKSRQYAPTDVGDLIVNQVELIQSEFDRRGIALTVRLPKYTIVAPICASEVALATVNLLRNALEAFENPSDGSLVSVSCRRLGQDWVEIEVADNGKGLAPEDVPMALGVFQTSKETGFGIGLSICQEVAEHHSGSIALMANAQGGLTAVLRLAVPPMD